MDTTLDSAAPKVAGAELTVTLHARRFLVVKGKDEASSQLSIEPDWQQKVSAMPYPTDGLTIVAGHVEYRDDRVDPPSRVLASLRAAVLSAALKA